MGRSLHARTRASHDDRPDRFDDPTRLAAFIDALRWGAITSADAQAAPGAFRSGANVEAYQLEPLRRALRAPAPTCSSPTTSASARPSRPAWSSRSCSSATAPAPRSSSARAGLPLKWQDEMIEKFGLDFTIINSETMREVRRQSHGLHANPFTLFPGSSSRCPGCPGSAPSDSCAYVYAQTASARAPVGSPSTSSIVDEAHHVAPSSPPRVDKLGHRRGAATPSTRSAPMPSASSPRSASTASSSPPPRITATRVVHRPAGDDRPAALRPRVAHRSEFGPQRGRCPAPKETLKEAKGFKERQVTAATIRAHRLGGRGVRAPPRLHEPA